MIGFRIISPNN